MMEASMMGMSTRLMAKQTAIAIDQMDLRHDVIRTGEEERDCTGLAFGVDGNALLPCKRLQSSTRLGEARRGRPIRWLEAAALTNLLLRYWR